MNNWRLKEVIVMAALSVVFGVVYLAFLPVGGVLVGFMGPIGYEPIFGIWFIVSIITATLFVNLEQKIRIETIVIPLK